MACQNNTDCYNLNCVAGRQGSNTCVNQAAPVDPPVCTLNVSQPANKCPNVFCVNDTECQSSYCYYMSGDDISGLCATLDEDPANGECYQNTTYSLNRCNGVSCDRDNQCASLVCGATGINGTCQAWGGEYVQPTDDQGSSDASSGSATTVIIVVSIVAAIALIGGFMYWRRNKNLRVELEGQNRALISND